jgi:hypothetical protein
MTLRFEKSGYKRRSGPILRNRAEDVGFKPMVTLPPQSHDRPFSGPAFSWTLQEPQTKRRKHQDDPDVYYQPLPELVPEEQDVNTDHDAYQREHVKRDGRLSSHRSCLLCATQWNKSGADFNEHLRGS